VSFKDTDVNLSSAAPSQPDLERPLLVHHVARLAGRSPRTIRHLAQMDELHGFRLGKKIWGFRRSEVERFLGYRHEL
jgi:hypothetical protein